MTLSLFWTGMLGMLVGIPLAFALMALLEYYYRFWWLWPFPRLIRYLKRLSSRNHKAP